jgi:Fur family ferric uptake transcriptional regulator
MVNNFLNKLREKGYRITPQREWVVQAVASHTSHFTAEMVSEFVQKKSKAVNLATIYRTLDLLVNERIISRSDLGQGQVIYANQIHGHHIHLVCRNCRQVIDARISCAESLEEVLEADYGFELDLNHISLFGICSNCKNGDNDHVAI